MKRSGTVAFSGAVLLLAMTVGQTPAIAQYDGGYAYPPGLYYGTPEYLDRIGEVLDAVDSPSRRSDLAENWLQFSKSAIAKNLEFRDRWLNLQKQQLSQDQRVEQQRLEMARLQMQIEQLRAENLKLERENLQIRMELNGQAGRQPPNGPVVQEPNAVVR